MADDHGERPSAGAQGARAKGLHGADRAAGPSFARVHGGGRGQAAGTLMLGDLVVQEDGVLQRVDTFHEAINPVTFMLALD